MDYIISWFYAENDEFKSEYSQVKADSTSNKFQEVYWRCVVSFYHASLQVNKNKKHLFYTNLKELPKIKDFELDKFFKNNDIEVRTLNLKTRTPEDWHFAWRNQFYVFDILNEFENYVTKEDNLLILDSDCVITKDLTPLFKDIRENGAVDYLYGYNDEENINGLNTVEMRRLFQEFYGYKEKVYYYGGEFIGVNGGLVSDIMNEFRNIWGLNYEKYSKKEIKLTEEAHFLSMIYHRLGLANSIGNQYIKRIWNGNAYNNVEDIDKDLFIYHLPAQKNTGFYYYFNLFAKRKLHHTKEELIKVFDIYKEKGNKRKIREVITKMLFKVGR